MNDLNIRDKITIREIQYQSYVTERYFQDINLTVHQCFCELKSRSIIADVLNKTLKAGI